MTRFPEQDRKSARRSWRAGGHCPQILFGFLVVRHGYQTHLSVIVECRKKSVRKYYYYFVVELITTQFRGVGGTHLYGIDLPLRVGGYNICNYVMQQIYSVTNAHFSSWVVCESDVM